MAVRPHVSCVLLAALFSCSSPTGSHLQEVTLATDLTAYADGGSIRVVLENNGPADVGPGNIAGTLLCPLSFEMMGTGGWEETWTFDACIMVGRPPLPAGGMVEMLIRVDTTRFPVPGEYRFRTFVIVGPGAVHMDVASNTFSIVR